MDEVTEQAKDFLNQCVKQVREENARMTRAEKKAQVEMVNRILFSLADEDREWLDRYMADDAILANDECEALYLAGLKDGLRLLKLMTL